MQHVADSMTHCTGLVYSDGIEECLFVVLGGYNYKSTRHYQVAQELDFKIVKGIRMHVFVRVFSITLYNY